MAGDVYHSRNLRDLRGDQYGGRTHIVAAPRAVSRPDARKISRQIFVTAAEEEDIRELVGRGVEVEIRALADDPKVDALSAL